ncbi:MAG: hypothetical protein IPM06_21950 [Rhizobiales bacterium]|nr:hypothetical protein [Hyphomicrobiales bacterium]
MNNKQIAAIGLDADFAGIFKHMDETSAWISAGRFTGGEDKAVQAQQAEALRRL